METGSAQDLRTWLREMEQARLVHRVTAEVDWDEEMAAIAYLVGRQPQGPTLLFDHISGFAPGSARVLFNPLGSSLPRIAAACQFPLSTAHRELVLGVRERLRRTGEPLQWLDPSNAPALTHTMTKDEVDLNQFPAPKFWPKDGGRYLGTAHVVITQDPESGVLNVGTYRAMMQDRRTLGWYCSPGKDGKLHRERYWAMGKPCPVVFAFGVHPLFYILGSQGFPKNQSEFAYLSGFFGKPVEVVKGPITGLPIPAYAEMVVEGYAYPEDEQSEGPFGEFTGYYGRPEASSPVVRVEQVYYRPQPIMTAALMANGMACELSTYFSVIRSAKIWDDLDRMGVPGIAGVYANPLAASGYGAVVVSVQQQYPGHAAQVLALTAQCMGAAYYTKWIIAVDDDVDPTDPNEVWMALTTRCSPRDDIDILRQTWSTSLDPTLNPPEIRPSGSKALINACMEYRYQSTFSQRTYMSRRTYEKVAGRWGELGLPGSVPVLARLDED